VEYDADCVAITSNLINEDFDVNAVQWKAPMGSRGLQAALMPGRSDRPVSLLWSPTVLYGELFKGYKSVKVEIAGLRDSIDGQ
jgi:hypothetical protein